MGKRLLPAHGFGGGREDGGHAHPLAFPIHLEFQGSAGRMLVESAADVDHDGRLDLYAAKGEEASSGSYHADNCGPSLYGGFTIIRSYDRIEGSDWPGIKNRIKDELRRFIFEKIKRNPMILPVIVEGLAYTLSVIAASQ